MDLSWIKDISPAWYYIGSLVAQAAVGGWFLRGLRADRDRIAADVADNGKAIAAAVALVTELRKDQEETQLAVGVQGSKIGSLEAGFGKLQDMILIEMPRAVENACERAEIRGEGRARRAERERRDRRR